MKLKTVSICIVVLAVTLSACAKGPAKSAARMEGRPTEAAARIATELRGFEEATSHIKALASLSVDSEERNIRSDAAIVIERPNRIRIDVIDSVADVWAQAGSDGDTLWLYVPGKKKLYEGRANAGNMSRLASFYLEPEDMISLVAGSPPISNGEELTEAGTGRQRHFLFSQSGLRCWLDKREKGRVSRCEKPAEGGGIDYEISFADYRKVGDARFPYSIDAKFPGRGAKLSIRYRDVESGGAADPASFMPPRVRGVSTHRYKR